MNRFKEMAFRREFPFLNEILGEKSPNSIKVKRLDQDVLKRIPDHSSHDGSMGSSANRDEVIFILSDGSTLRDAVEPEECHRSNYAHSSEIFEEGETLLEAIDRLPVPGSLSCVVWVSEGHNRWEGSLQEDWLRVEIFKPPKSEKISDILAAAHEAAQREVAAEANF